MAGVALGNVSLCVAGVAVGELGWVWWRAWELLVAPGAGAGAPSFCVAGVTLGDIHLPFAWQAWHLLTSTFVLRGRRGTWALRGLGWAGSGGAVGSCWSP